MECPTRVSVRGSGRSGGWLALLVLTAVIVLIPVSVGSARAGPNIICICGCKECSNTCPTGISLTYSISVQANDTNTTISFKETDSLGYSFINLSWGPGSDSEFLALTDYFSNTSPSSGSVFLDYLAPVTEYSYWLRGWSYCVDSAGTHMYHTQSTYTESWDTASDSATVIQGVIRDPESYYAPYNQLIYWTAGCLGGFGDDYTTSGGQFSISVATCTSSPPYTLNYENCRGLSGCWSDNGIGHWNATLVVQAPGYYTLWVPENYKTYVPASAMFVHSASIDISSYSSSIYTETQSTVDNGGNGTSTSEESEIQWGTTSVPAGDSLLTETEYWTSGTVDVDPSDRLSDTTAISFFDQTGYEFDVNGWSDWQTTTPGSGYCSKFNTATSTVTLTISGSFAVSSGYDVDIGIDLGLPTGVGVDVGGSISVPIQNTLESVSGYSSSATFTLTNPSPGSWAYFLTNTQGGSTGDNDLSAIIAHVYQVTSC
jgi:hypothetical protein